ncbi:MAG: electron transfer flavoprotein subunit alpha/FixB family protein [Anaerolineales bacterium]|nr:electron transfer flavoprotein subunit alpha/FixB family protein [Anaerolineales bacterium]
MESSFLDLLLAQQPAPEAGEKEPGGEGGIWVVADVHQGTLAQVTLEALGAARTLADALGAYVVAVVLGKNVAGLASTLYQAGADGVRIADHPALADYALEPYLAVLTELLTAEQPEVVMCGATPQGHELAGHLAQRMGGGLIEHVVQVTLDETTRTVQAAYPIYGGEYFDIAASPNARPQFLTVEPGAFSVPFLDPFRQGEPVLLSVEPLVGTVQNLGPVSDFTPPAIPLSQADVIVAVGRQVGDFELAQQLAAALGAQLAGDRGARDAGWVGPAQVVDIRATRTAPKVYVAVGIRGDTFHNAAIEEADFVLAIHPDPDAPIFEVADLCLEADPAEVLPALLRALQN